MKEYIFRVILLGTLVCATLVVSGVASSKEPGIRQPIVTLQVAGISYVVYAKTSMQELGLSDAEPQSEIKPTNGLVIVSLPKRNVSIVHDGTKESVALSGELVGQAPNEAGLALGPLDRTVPSADTPLTADMTIEIVRVSQEERTEQTPIPFQVTAHNNPDMLWGTKKIVQKGAKGVREERVLVLAENGETVERTVLSSQTITPPKEQIEEVGTKIIVGKTVEGIGSWYSFRKGMFAASTIFPRGTFLRVTNLENGKRVLVQVNDYGPTTPGRVIDLEAAAFMALGKPLWQGLMRVRVEEILQ